MRATELSAFGIEGLRSVERPLPTLRAGEVLVEVRAASLNYHDLMTVVGKANPRLRLPVIPLSDGAGVVSALGEGVRGLAVGDRVMSTFFPDWVAGEPTPERLARVTGETLDGCLSDYVKLPASGVVKVPDYLSDVEASTLPCAALTAWRALVVEGRVKTGDTVVVQGTGGVSVFALQFAKLLGAHVIATSSSDEKLARVRELGADQTINYKTKPEWAREVKGLTGGRGADLIVEVGGSGTFDQSLRAVRLGGHVSMIGVLTGWADTVSTARIMALNIAVKGITVANRDDFEAMLRAMSQHRLRPVIGETLRFEEGADALRRMSTAAHFGKICLTRD